jgi:autotransporter-associated beta strand protein
MPRLCCVVEALEQRVMPAMLHWVGGDSVNPTGWNDAANWVENAVPATGDTIVFDTTAATIKSFTTINDFSTSVSVGVIVINDADTTAGHDFSFSGHAVTITGGITHSMQGSATNLNFASITVGASEPWTNSQGSLVIACPVDLHGNTLTVGGSNNTTFNGNITSSVAGTDALVKTGGGTATVAGSSNTYDGATTVSGGLLAVTGTVTQSAISVLNGGTLGGTGTAAGVAASSGGVVSAANAIGATGTLNTGNVALATASTLQVDIGGTAAGQYDQLNIGAANTVNLDSDSGAGASLNITLVNGFLPSLGQTFTILNSQGTSAISGTFNGIGQNGTLIVANRYTFQVNYTSGPNHNNVVLTVIRVPGPLDHFSVNASPSSMPAGSTATFVVTAVDTGGFTANYNGVVHFTSSDPLSTPLPDSSLTNSVGTFSLILRTAGAQTLTAHDTGSAATGTSNGVTVTPLAAIHLAVAGPTAAGTGLAFNFTVTAEDQFNNPATYSGTLHFASSDGAANLPGNMPISNGLGTYSATLNTTGNQAIMAADANNSSMMGTSGSIAVNARTASQLAFVNQAGATTAGASIAPALQVAVEDQFGSILTGNTSNVTLALGANPSGGTLSGSLTVAAVNGVATFSTLSINKVGTGYTLTAADGTLTGATSSAFNILVGTASKLVFAVQPGNATAGSTIAPAVQVAVTDASGNVVTSNSSSVTVAVGSNAGGGTLGGMATVAASSGLATFSNLSINKSGSGYTLTAADGALTPGTSTAFNIVAGPVDHLGVTANPTSVTAGAGFLLTVTAQDVLNNPTSGYNGTVHFSSADPLAPSPASNTTISDGVGVAVGTLFTAGSWTVQATDTVTPALTGVSGSIAVSAAAAARLLVGAPASAITGKPVSVTVTAVDSYNNVASGYRGNVSLASSDTAAAFAPNPYTFSSGDAGIHTFSATLNTSGSQTIRAADTATPAINGSTNPVTTRGLTVQSVTPTTSGFVVTFNKPYDPSSLNLYDGGSHTLGDSDLNLVGATTGALAGSLVLNQAANSLTFTYTFGLLPDDNYTLTLVSGASAFKDLSGASLDGNNDGVNGDNYTTAFATNYHATSVGLGVPSFARGPAQDVSLVVPGQSPNLYPGLPVQLSDGNHATTAAFTLTYNTALLSVTGATVDTGSALYPDAPVGSTFTRTSHTVTGGIATDVFAFNTNGHGDLGTGAGAVTIGELTANIPNAPGQTIYGAKQVVHVAGVSVNGTHAGVGVDAIEVVAFPGDGSGDAQLLGNDGALAGRVAGGLDTGFRAFPLTDPVLIADVAGNGIVDANDASEVLQKSVNHSVPNIPSIPAGAQVASAGPDPTLSLPNRLQVTAGGTLTVPVNLDDPHPAGSSGLTEATLALRFDPAELTVSPGDVHLGSIPSSGNGWTLTSSVDNSSGQLGIVLYSLSPITAPAGGSLVTIDFHVRTAAPLGVGTIALAATVDPNGLLVHTGVADEQGAMTLSQGAPAIAAVVGLVQAALPTLGPSPAGGSETIQGESRTDLSPGAMLARTSADTLDQLTDIGEEPPAMPAPASHSPAHLTGVVSGTAGFPAPVVSPAGALIVSPLTTAAVAGPLAITGLADLHAADRLFVSLITSAADPGSGEDPFARQVPLPGAATSELEGDPWDGQFVESDGLRSLNESRSARPVRIGVNRLTSEATSSPAVDLAAVTQYFARTADADDRLDEE